MAKLTLENKGLRVITLADEGKEHHLAPRSKLKVTEETAKRIHKLYPREVAILENVVSELQDELDGQDNPVEPKDDVEAPQAPEDTSGDDEGDEDEHYDFETPEGEKINLEDQTIKVLRETAKTLECEIPADVKKHADIVAVIRAHLEKDAGEDDAATDAE